MTTFPSARRHLVAAAALAALAVPALAQPSPRAAAPSSAPASAAGTLAMAAAAASALPDAAPREGDVQLVAAADVQRVTITGSSDDGYGGRASTSATGLDLSLRETPQSITVISREQMDDFALTTINDVLALTPGVTVESVETD